MVILTDLHRTVESMSTLQGPMGLLLRSNLRLGVVLMLYLLQEFYEAITSLKLAFRARPAKDLPLNTATTSNSNTITLANPSIDTLHAPSIDLEMLPRKQKPTVAANAPFLAPDRDITICELNSILLPC